MRGGAEGEVSVAVGAVLHRIDPAADVDAAGHGETRRPERRRPERDHIPEPTTPDRAQEKRISA